MSMITDYLARKPLAIFITSPAPDDGEPILPLHERPLYITLASDNPSEGDGLTPVKLAKADLKTIVQVITDLYVGFGVASIPSTPSPQEQNPIVDFYDDEDF